MNWDGESTVLTTIRSKIWTGMTFTRVGKSVGQSRNNFSTGFLTQSSSTSSPFPLLQSLSLSNGTIDLENVPRGGTSGGGGDMVRRRQAWPASRVARDAAAAAAAAAAAETRPPPPFMEQPVTEISDQELAALGFPIEDGEATAASAAAAAAPDSGGGGGGGVIDSPFIHFTSREFPFRSSHWSSPSIPLFSFSLCSKRL